MKYYSIVYKHFLLKNKEKFLNHKEIYTDASKFEKKVGITVASKDQNHIVIHNTNALTLLLQSMLKLLLFKKRYIVFLT